MSVQIACGSMARGTWNNSNFKEKKKKAPSNYSCWKTEQETSPWHREVPETKPFFEYQQDFIKAKERHLRDKKQNNNNSKNTHRYGSSVFRMLHIKSQQMENEAICYFHFLVFSMQSYQISACWVQWLPLSLQHLLESNFLRAFD